MHRTELSKLYSALVVFGASSIGLAGCGGEDTGTGQEPQTGNSGGSGTGGSSSQGGGQPSGGSSSQNACEAQCHVSGTWKYCNGNCCWLGATDPCCN